MSQEAPWSIWSDDVMDSANKAIDKDFSDPDWGTSSTYDDGWVSARGQYAQNLAFAYLLTGNTKYASKARQALLYLDIAKKPGNTSMMTPEGFQSIGLHGYCFAYDWIQPTLSTRDDAAVRDKLATLADTVYKSLNSDTVNPDYRYKTYPYFPDFLGQAYPTLGIAGTVLNDYTNPNNLSLTSTPAMWLRVATYDFFVNDELHPQFNRPCYAYDFDDAGIDMEGSYKCYVADDLALWAQVYTHYYGKNFFDVYPEAKKILTSEEWESLPNYYSNDLVCQGNMKYDYHIAILNLLSDDEKAYLLKHDETLDNSSLLPYSGTMNHIYYGTRVPMMPAFLLYTVYDSYPGIQRKDPSYTSHLDTSSIYQVFRENWGQDSNWLSLITWDIEGLANRDMEHQDQLSFEYYGHGDLLMSDGGEDKNVLDKYYGQYESYHNTIAIEDPRSPFSTSKWADSIARGIFKGSWNLATSASIDSIVSTPWMELVDASADIREVDTHAPKSPNSQSLSSPIYYERAILYPDKDYFVVIDRMDGSQTWGYRNIFRPTSLSITPSTGTSESEVGHVNGDLKIGATSYDWLSLPYKQETSTGITTNSITWNVKNMYGNDVELQVYSVPASEILLTKHVSRIGGYGQKSEVFSPIIYYRMAPAKDLYRVTAIVSRYPNEAARDMQTLTVSGTGNAVKVASSGYDDYVYTGKGTSSFGTFTTDADTAFIRRTSEPIEYTLIGGTYLRDGQNSLLTLSSKADYITLKKNNTGIAFQINGSANTVTVGGLRNPANNCQVLKDGQLYKDWTVADNNAIKIMADRGEHIFEIRASANGIF